MQKGAGNGVRFVNRIVDHYQIVFIGVVQVVAKLVQHNAGEAQIIEGSAALLAAGVLSKCVYGVKVLGNGSLTKKLTVKASAFSESAKQKIEAVGGKAEVV